MRQSEEKGTIVDKVPCRKPTLSACSERDTVRGGGSPGMN